MPVFRINLLVRFTEPSFNCKSQTFSNSTNGTVHQLMSCVSMVELGAGTLAFEWQCTYRTTQETLLVKTNYHQYVLNLWISATNNHTVSLTEIDSFSVSADWQ